MLNRKIFCESGPWSSRSDNGQVVVVSCLGFRFSFSLVDENETELHHFRYRYRRRRQKNTTGDIMVQWHSAVAVSVTDGSRDSTALRRDCWVTCDITAVNCTLRALYCNQSESMISKGKGWTFPRLLLLLLSISVFTFQFFCFTLFSCRFRAVD